MKIELDAMMTPYTLDTYQTFTFDNAEEIIMENEGKDYDAIEWDYDNAGYLQALAENWIILLNKNILDDIIFHIEADGLAWSPKEYNFSTDNLNAIFDVNIDALNLYIAKNADDYAKNKLKDADGFMWLGDENQTMLAYYLTTESVKKYNTNDYYMDQFEAVPEYDYIDYKIIDKPTPAERLEYLRGEIKAERISYEEIAELQSLAQYIEPGDVELLEWAGVEKNNDSFAPAHSVDEK